MASAAPQRSIPSRAPVAGYRVVHVFPHDPQAFTQGLVYLDGVLYEGTGLNGRSSIRKVKIENGEVLQLQKVDPQYFGEGIAVVGDTIFELTWQSGIGFLYDRASFQRKGTFTYRGEGIAVVGDTIFELTWQSGIGFLYDRASFQRKGTFTYRGEGWGLTFDGKRLIMSDGSALLQFLDPATQKVISRLEVRDGGSPVLNLNELEYVKGEIFANVWQTNRIARISPKTGRVTGWIDLTGLLSAREAEGTDVMNGIAYDAARDRLFVTGKLWPKVFEIRIVP